MSAINTGSGSVYPGKELLDFQLESSGKKKVTLSSARGGDLPIWDKTYVDLTRLGTLEANGETIYSNGIPEEIGEAAEKTKFVFDSLAEKLDSTSLAHKAIDLFEQDLGGDVLSKVAQQKGFSRYDAELDTMVSTHSVVAKRQFNAITTKGSDFQVIHEELVQVRPMDNPESVSYFKVKTMVKGKTKALEGRDTRRMSVSAAYTKEYSTMEDAFQATYLGTRAGGLSNTESYIKE